MTRLTNASNYHACRQGRKVLPRVRELLQVKGVYLSNGGIIPELTELQRHFSNYCVVVYSELRRCNIMLYNQVAAQLRINLQRDEGHFHVIKNLTRAKAKHSIQAYGASDTRLTCHVVVHPVRVRK